MVAEPLARSRPLWSAAFVTCLAGNGVALVVVFHHVVADGLGGLSVLARLVDQAATHQRDRFPHARPPETSHQKPRGTGAGRGAAPARISNQDPRTASPLG